MGFMDDAMEMSQEAMDKGYVEDAFKKYDFKDFGDATSCCDELERALQMGNTVKAVGLELALMGALDNFYSDREISSTYIVRIYKYCRGMDHDYAALAIYSIMDKHSIEA